MPVTIEKYFSMYCYVNVKRCVPTKSHCSHFKKNELSYELKFEEIDSPKIGIFIYFH